MTATNTILYNQPSQRRFLEEIVLEQEEEEEEEEEDKNADTVTFACFEKLNNKRISCLLLGYQNGFQLWDITNPDNVHEICSIRDKEIFGTVSCIHLINNDSLAIITEKDNKQSNMIIYSLDTHSIIKEIAQFAQEDNNPVLITRIQSNHKIIALGCLSRHKSFIYLLSAVDFKQITNPLVDVYHDINTGPIFTLNSRFIAYATNTAVLYSDPVMASFSNKLQLEKDVKGAAKDIAKEVVSGMKSLGEFSYHQLSNYFSTPTSPITDKKVITPSGMVMIRDTQALITRNNSIIAHFRPHTHPISCLSFNPSGTLLLSASKQGHTFHIFSILTNILAVGNVSHLYSLSRGYTDAQVEDCQFSNDSNWCAISTARGTTHLYAINPYGGKPEISGHIHNKVNNRNRRHPFVSKIKPKTLSATVLNPVMRIKQRKRMPESLNQEEMYVNNLRSPLPPPRLSHLQKEPRAKLTAFFINTSSFLINNDITVKQPATHLLKHTPYLPQQQLQQNDTLMFGFDEEYDDSVKTVNDEVGWQDIYTFHPNGILTLYRCWITKAALKKREGSKNISDLSVRKESIAEWKVARNIDWKQVQLKIDSNFTEKKREKKKKDDKRLFWLSNAEISTYSSDELPIWSQRQFIFQTYKELPCNNTSGIIPATNTLLMPKEIPEPISSRMDRVRKTMTRLTNDTVEENMDDALAELEDNLSNAMQTSFSFTNSISSSPASTVKWLSTSANAISGAASLSKFFANKNSSLSFEDAYLINMGNGPSSEPSMNHHSTVSSIVHLKEDSSVEEEEVIRFENDLQNNNNLYSPDGDNEVAYPYESIYNEEIWH
ncbi:hypothetical protein G6F42_001503 [Rhizopus arrhizus]|nr:hypothetical protein G6F42_001503 [Rhizopus arrhizus]